jgi:amidase
MTIQLFAVQGPMARHVRDLRLAFENMLAPDSRDPWHAPAPFAGPPAPRRVALTVDPGGEGVDPDVAAGVRKAAEALKDAGYEVVEVDPPDVSAARDLWAKQVMTEVALGFKPLLAQIGGKDANAFLETSISVVPDLDLAGYMHSFAARLTLARAWSTFQAEYPLILGPVSTAQPFHVGFDLAGPDEVMQLLRSKRLIVALNLLGLPAVVVPTGVAQGLPQAVEVIGANFREDLCLEAAEAIEERLGVITPIDPR